MSVSKRRYFLCNCRGARIRYLFPCCTTSKQLLQEKMQIKFQLLRQSNILKRNC